MPKAKPSSQEPKASKETIPLDSSPLETVKLPEEDLIPTESDSAAASTPDLTKPGQEQVQIPETVYIPPAAPTPPPPPLPPAPPIVTPQPLSPNDERTWAMLAHLSVLANLVTGFLGPVIALVIYLVFKDRSRYVAYQSMQAFVFQLVWWVGGGILAAIAWAVSGALTVLVVGCCLYPFALLLSLLPLGALVYGVIGAIQTSQGKDFKYWLIGDWVRGTLTGK